MERILVRNLHPGPDWIPGIIAEVLGPVTYVIETDEGQRWKRHADQIKNWIAPAPQAELAPAAENADDDTPPLPQDPRVGHCPVESGTPVEPPTGLEVTGHDPPDPGGSGQLPEMPLPSTPVAEATEITEATENSKRRYPSRNWHPPIRYQ